MPRQAVDSLANSIVAAIIVLPARSTLLVDADVSLTYGEGCRRVAALAVLVGHWCAIANNSTLSEVTKPGIAITVHGAAFDAGA
jgi:hypothetical protein